MLFQVRGDRLGKGEGPPPGIGFRRAEDQAAIVELLQLLLNGSGAVEKVDVSAAKPEQLA